jgi:hypothetical protein
MFSATLDISVSIPITRLAVETSGPLEWNTVQLIMNARSSLNTTEVVQYLNGFDRNQVQVSVHKTNVQATVPCIMDQAMWPLCADNV